MGKSWFVAACAAAALVAGDALAQKVKLVLNSVPTADHSPYFYAKEQGWYSKAGSISRSSSARALRCRLH